MEMTFNDWMAVIEYKPKSIRELKLKMKEYPKAKVCYYTYYLEDLNKSIVKLLQNGKE